MNISPSEDDSDVIVENYVPTKLAYSAAACLLFLSGLTGGLIGYAMMKVFFPDSGALTRSIGTLVICAAIVYGVSVITSLGLQASVEWKARKTIGPEKNRPSRLVRTNNRD